MPRSGNAVRIVFRGALPNTFSFLQFGLNRTATPLAALGLPGGTQNVVAITGLLGLINGAGWTYYDLPLSANPVFVGTEIVFQHYPFDPSLSTAPQVTASSAASITIGL